MALESSADDIRTVDMAVDLSGLRLKNPVMPASGTFGFGAEFEQYMDISSLGALVVKGLTLKPRDGNIPIRIWETASGMLNCIGLQNPGIDSYIKNYLPRLRTYGVPVIANISGDTVEDYGNLAMMLEASKGADAIEVNISCPNVKHGGLAFGADPKSAAAVTRSVRRKTSLPVIVKLSPNVTDIAEIAKAVEAEGADAVSLINTLLGMAIDIDSRRPALGNIFGGLSGPAVKPVALRMVWQVYNAINLPIVGMGGIVTGKDAVEFILAGASAVAVGTGNFLKPDCCLDVLDGIRRFMVKNGFNTVDEIVGLAHNMIS